MRSFLTVVAVLVSVAVPLGAQGSPSLTPAQRDELRAFLDAHAQPPEDYVLAKFATHDLVLIGEPHWVRQHVEFMQGMIPRLYQKGIHTLAMEFARRVDQPLIDSLLSHPVYDEALAERLLMQSLVEWGYQEYADLYRVAWQLNRTLPAGARPFRILALNGAPDWSIIKTEAEFDDWRLRLAAIHCQTESDWAQLLIDSVLAKHEKALVYTGTHHAFTKYGQPIVRNGTLLRLESERFGQYLYQKVPQQIFMIVLDRPWPGLTDYEAPVVLPANGAIAEALHATPQQRVVFDLVGTPFGALISDNTVYKHGHEPFTLDKMADGYIVLGPIAGFEPVHPIPNFVNASNLDYARRHVARPSERNLTAQEFNDLIAQSLDVIRHWSKLGAPSR